MESGLKARVYVQGRGGGTGGGGGGGGGVWGGGGGYQNSSIHFLARLCQAEMMQEMRDNSRTPAFVNIFGKLPTKFETVSEFSVNIIAENPVRFACDGLGLLYSFLDTSECRVPVAKKES